MDIGRNIKFPLTPLTKELRDFDHASSDVRTMINAVIGNHLYATVYGILNPIKWDILLKVYSRTISTWR
jgi:hypothetical protein